MVVLDSDPGSGGTGDSTEQYSGISAGNVPRRLSVAVHGGVHSADACAESWITAAHAFARHFCCVPVSRYAGDWVLDGHDLPTSEGMIEHTIQQYRWHMLPGAG